MHGVHIYFKPGSKITKSNSAELKTVGDDSCSTLEEEEENYLHGCQHVKHPYSQKIINISKINNM